MKRKILALLLCACMVLSMMPTIFAADGDANDVVEEVPNANTYVKVTNNTIQSGETYLLVDTAKREILTVNGSKLYPEYLTSVTDEFKATQFSPIANYEWKITKSSSNYTFANGSKSSNNYIRLKLPALGDTELGGSQNLKITWVDGKIRIGSGSYYLNRRTDVKAYNSSYAQSDGVLFTLYEFRTGVGTHWTVKASAIADQVARVTLPEDRYTVSSWRDYQTALNEATYGEYTTAEEARAAYYALVAAVDALELAEFVIFNTANQNISWKRTQDTRNNYVANVPYVNDGGSYTWNSVVYPQYTALNWNWSSINRLITNQDTRTDNVWSTNSSGISSCTFSNNASSNWTQENFYKIAGTFRWPAGYDLDETTITIQSANDAKYGAIYDYINQNGLSEYFEGGKVIPVNDDAYVVMWVEDGYTNVNASNIDNYLLFWTGTSGKGIWSTYQQTGADWDRTKPATFISAMRPGVRAFRNAWPNAVGVIPGLTNINVANNSSLPFSHTDGWYTLADTSAINSVMRNNYSSIAEGAIVHIDLYVANNGGTGAIDELEIKLSKKPQNETDVTVEYYYGSVDAVGYLGSSVLTNVPYGTKVTLVNGTNASQLNYMQAAAVHKSHLEVTDGYQLGAVPFTVTKNGVNVIQVLYTAANAKFLTLTAESATFAFDPNNVVAHTLSNVTVKEDGYNGTVSTQNGSVTLPDGNTLRDAVATVTATYPGIYENAFATDPNVKNGDDDVTGSYVITKNPGTLTITYSAPSATVTYDFAATNIYDVLVGPEAEAVVTAPEDSTVSVVGDKIYYSPAAAGMSETVPLTLTFPGNYQVTKNVTFVPASNVLFEAESFANTADAADAASAWYIDADEADEFDIAIDDNANTAFGYSESYVLETHFASGATYVAGLTIPSGKTNVITDGMTFSFKGTGIDVISACSDNTGILVTYLTGKDNGVKKVFITDTYFSGDELLDDDYQVPVVRVLDLPYGEYNVEVKGFLNTNAGTVVKPHSFGGASTQSLTGASTDSLVSEILKAAGLSSVTDVSVSFVDENSVLNGGTGNMKASPVRSSMSKVGLMSITPAEPASETAYVYVDAFRVYQPMGADFTGYTESENNTVYKNVYDFVAASVDEIYGTLEEENAFIYAEYDKEQDLTLIKEYKNQGPNNELYLPEDSRIAFALNGYTEGMTVQIGAKAVTEGAILNEEYGLSGTELYYDVEVLKVGDLAYVYIQNNGDGMLAISGLKLDKAITPMATTELATVLLDTNTEEPVETFVPDIFSVSHVSTVKSGKSTSLTIKASAADVAKVVVTSDNGSEQTFTKANATNKTAVALGLYNYYSFTYKTGTLTKETTYTIVAYNADGVASEPITVTIKIK